MGKVMIQMAFPKGKPSLAEAAQALGLDESELDRDFGVIETDPERRLFALRVEESAAPRAAEAIRARASGDAEGLFSDPKIAPFGPPD
jgi:hypothetical protein